MEHNRNERKKHISISDTAIAVLLAWAGAIGAAGIVAPGSTALAVYEDAIRNTSITYTNSFLAFLFFVVNFFLLKRIYPDFKCAERIQKVCAYIFSALLSVALHFGAKLESVENVDFKDGMMYISIILFTMYLAPVVSFLWNEMSCFCRSLFEERVEKAENGKKRISYFKIWGIVFVLWIPTFLAFFPGAFVYDATDEYIQVITREFSMHHPLVHVLALGGIVHAAEYMGFGANLGIAVYTILQMAVCSGVIAYLICFLQRRGANKRLLLGTILFFGLFPVFPMYAVCSAKDTLFTSFFLLMAVLLWEYIIDDADFFKRKYILFVAASSMMMLLRNNGMYAYLVAVPVIGVCLFAGKTNRKSIIKFLTLMILSVVIYKGANECLKIACHATDNEHQEILTVPIQQLARVYKYSPEVFTEDEKAVLYEVLPQNYLITYNARCSDVLKSGFNNENYEKNPERYRKLWFSILKRKPLVYLNAWLVNSYGYWYPDMIINVYGGNQMYTYKYENSSYFGFETEPPGERHSLFPLYERFYRNVSLELFQQKVPVLSMFFSPGFIFVLVAWSIFGVMAKKEWKTISVFVPTILLWCTVLLGPTVLVRYVLILWCIIPLLIAAMGKERN